MGVSCFFHASFLLQSMFAKSELSVDYSTAGAKDSGMGKLFSIELDFVKNGVIDDSYQLTTFCVWGAMQIGERYNGDRTVKWFKNYPFTLGMYTAAAATLSYKIGGSQVNTCSVSGRGAWNILPPSTLAESGSDVLVYLSGSSSVYSVFDHTYDHTFKGLLNTATNVTLKIDDSNSGVYLRWVNRHGVYCYWLFVGGDQQKQVSNDGEFVRNNMQDYSYTNGYHGGSGRKQRKSESSSIPVCAVFVDSDTYDFLYELALSPVVDMYVKDADKWLAVNVSVDTFVKTRSSLQDFVATVILPETRTVSL